ncbi:hypothetical protein [Nocardia farcinica]|uniref:hypothetical protein n=1 Tax=Nocardia farcinica TaxID=37329 RepID=UPI002458DB28|nr:hypothetical protein [Nocardia farcinica]
MSDLEVELQLLENLARGWSDEIEPKLNSAATMIDGLKYSRIQFGIFQMMWQEYTETAQYIQDRLREGAARADEMGGALLTVRQTYQQTDEGNAAALYQAEGEVDFSI